MGGLEEDPLTGEISCGPENHELLKIVRSETLVPAIGVFIVCSPDGPDDAPIAGLGRGD